MKREMTKSVAKGIKTVLESVLKVEANTASCAIMYEPKAPDQLKRYRRDK